MYDPSELGVFASTHSLDRKELVRLVQNTEDLGYRSLWFPEALSYESFSLASYLLSNSNKLKIGTGIANIYARDAVTSAQGYDSLNRLFDDRFVLGLGVSHISFVEGARGHEYGKPLSTMTRYLETISNAVIDKTLRIKNRNIVLAALGPKMLKLAATKSKGAIPYSVTPEHTAQAREVLGPRAWLFVEQKVCLTSNKSEARAVAQEQMGRYIKWQNYRNNWLRMGFDEDDLKGEGSSRFLDAMVCWGNEKKIQDCLEAHFRAGASQVLIQAFNPEGSHGTDLRALRAFAPNN